MRHRMRPVLLALALIACACTRPAPAPHAPPPLLVAAASSLRDLLESTQALFSGARVTFSFEASSSLARKINEGAAFDVFLSADAECMDHVKGTTDAATIGAFLSNRLALVHRDGLADPVAHPRDLAARTGPVALAGPAVPAGKYARQYLTHIGILDALGGRIANADSVRGALALVESGAADYGMVYLTDARTAKSSRLAWYDAAGEGPVVTYVAGAINRPGPPAPDPGLARAYLAWLRSDAFLDAAEAMGFLRPPL